MSSVPSSRSSPQQLWLSSIIEPSSSEDEMIDDTDDDSRRYAALAADADNSGPFADDFDDDDDPTVGDPGGRHLFSTVRHYHNNTNNCDDMSSLTDSVGARLPMGPLYPIEMATWYRLNRGHRFRNNEVRVRVNNEDGEEVKIVALEISDAKDGEDGLIQLALIQKDQVGDDEDDESISAEIVQCPRLLASRILVHENGRRYCDTALDDQYFRLEYLNMFRFTHEATGAVLEVSSGELCP